MAAVRLSNQASKDLEKLARSDRQLFERVDAALTRLGEEPTVGKPLQGPLAGLRSLRVGDLRIVYRHDAAQRLILVLDIARRNKAYRRSESSSGAVGRADTRPERPISRGPGSQPKPKRPRRG